MTDLDKMSRELLAAECPECGGDGGFEFIDGDWRNCGRCADAHTVPRSQAESAIRAALLSAPPGYVLVPVELADRLQASIGAFVSDEGWSAADMGAADDLSALLAAAPQPKDQTP